MIFKDEDLADSLKLGRRREREDIIKMIDEMIRKPYYMCGGDPKLNKIFREGRRCGLRKLKDSLFTGSGKQ